MKHPIWSFTILTALALALPSLAHSQESTFDVVKKRGTLIAGVRNEFPPLGYVDKQQQWVGHDIELVEYVAKKLGVKLEKVAVTSVSRIPMLTNGNIDVLTSLSPTRERAKVGDFTVTYFLGGSGILVKKDSGIRGIADLASPRKTGTTQGSSDGPSVLSFQPKADVVYFQEYPLAFLALKQGRIDAISTTDSVLRGFARNDPDFIVLPPFKPDPVVMMVRPNDSKWRQFLNEAIMDAWCDGTLAGLFEKYVGGPMNFEVALWSDYYGNCKYNKP